MFADFVNWFSKLIAPIFTFFGEWWFLIVPFSYIEFGYLSGKKCRKTMLNKGYADERKWFVTGLLFNLIGIAFCELMPYNVQPAASAQPDVMRCQHCGGMNTQDAAFCRHCGSKMK